VRQILVVLVADVLHQLLALLVRRVAVESKRSRLHSGVVDSDFIVQMIGIGTTVALDDVQLFRVLDTVGFNEKFWFDFAGHPATTSVSPSHRGLPSSVVAPAVTT
jgi:hypothetical protein